MNESAKIDNSTILVTGATGFVGSHLVERLLGRNCKIHCATRKDSDLQWLDPARLTLHTVDLAHPPSLKEALIDAEYVFHCAGLTKAKTRKEYFLANAGASAGLYKACAEYGAKLKSIIHLSSLAATGPSAFNKPVDENSDCRPITHYGKSKLAGEEIARDFSATLPIVILRPPVVYGPRETDFFNYLKIIRKGWNPVVGRAQRELSLIYVKDLVDAMVTAAENPVGQENIFFITDGNNYSWDEVAQTAMNIIGVKAKTVVIPEWVLPPAALLAEVWSSLGSAPALLNRQKVKEICEKSWTASAKKFFASHSFQPRYDLKRGLAESVDWYKKNRWL